ncbi:hypothetical protein [Nitrosarchaeum sp. AC2]|uniref:hypothetical protein n=1 Tax=Nitrosarchaeum sp. AC2 TaxID=2259673 RepID=UPI0015C8E58D|nr:hypothetical protein [Nitrosarchaeum sp. AC2]
MEFKIFTCKHKNLKYITKFSVNGEIKTYKLCEKCEKLPCFSKYRIQDSEHMKQIND